MTKEDMTTKSQENKSNDSDKTGEEKYLLGQILVDLGYITIYQLDEALQLQRTDAEANSEQKPLGQWLLELGYCGPNQPAQLPGPGPALHPGFDHLRH